MPGTPGAKEVYGVSIIGEDLRIIIPPKAYERYEVNDGDMIALATGHRGEGGFGLMKKEMAEATVFRKYIQQIDGIDIVYWFNDKAYVLTKVADGKIQLTSEMMDSFHLKKGDELMVVKSTTVAMSYTPVEIWKEKFAKHGLYEAIENMSGLEEY